VAYSEASWEEYMVGYFMMFEYVEYIVLNDRMIDESGMELVWPD
jgi:hypothetical protein